MLCDFPHENNLFDSDKQCDLKCCALLQFFSKAAFNKNEPHNFFPITFALQSSQTERYRSPLSLLVYLSQSKSSEVTFCEVTNRNVCMTQWVTCY